MAKIMVVDDSRLARTLIKRIVEARGHRVVCEASNGREALEILPNCLPDILVLDISMPEMNGLELLKELKSRGLLDRVSVIMLTALDQPWSIEEAKRLGVSAFLSKPIKPEKLVEVLESLERV